MNSTREKTIIPIVIALIVGIALGLLYGWVINPVEYTGAGPQDLLPSVQENYLRSTADLYAFDGNQDRVRRALTIWPEANLAICRMAAASNDAADQSRLTALAGVMNNGAGCDPAALAASAAAADTADTGSNSSGLLLICGLGLLLLALLGGIYALWQRQNSSDSSSSYSDISTTHSPLPSFQEQEGEDDVEYEAPAAESVSEPTQIKTTPVARFRTSFKRGHDTYDDSFSIENTTGEFLGECGVGISESIGIDSPKNVTALEIWLFDKNDIRTVTKVVMSDHAFFDDALKAKLAPKGEPILARQGDTVVLETASLIINAVIAEMGYGDSSDLPAQSYLENFTVELSAWTKEGDANSLA